MMCDFIIAADTAKFGQPEIKLGIIPASAARSGLPAPSQGEGHGPDLDRRMMDAPRPSARVWSHACPGGEPDGGAMKVAETIAALSQPSLLAAKEAVNRSFETSLAEGVRFERRVFHALFRPRIARRADRLHRETPAAVHE